MGGACSFAWYVVAGHKMPFVYMYFVLEYMYDYADWSSYLECGLLI